MAKEQVSRKIFEFAQPHTNELKLEIIRFWRNVTSWDF